MFNLGERTATTAIDHIPLGRISGPLKKVVAGAGGSFYPIKKGKCHSVPGWLSLFWVLSPCSSAFHKEPDQLRKMEDFSATK